MKTGWPTASAPGFRGERRREERRTAFAASSPDALWTALIGKVRGFAAGDVHGPGVLTDLTEALTKCRGAPLPVEGEDAAACAMALIEMVRTWTRSGEDRRGWHSASILALAEQCEALMAQRQAAFSRRTLGERD